MRRRARRRGPQRPSWVRAGRARTRAGGVSPKRAATPNPVPGSRDTDSASTSAADTWRWTPSARNGQARRTGSPWPRWIGSAAASERSFRNQPRRRLYGPTGQPSRSKTTRTTCRRQLRGLQVGNRRGRLPAAHATDGRWRAFDYLLDAISLRGDPIPTQLGSDGRRTSALPTWLDGVIHLSLVVYAALWVICGNRPRGTVSRFDGQA
jgi:hypothetical protein